MFYSQGLGDFKRSTTQLAPIMRISSLIKYNRYIAHIYNAYLSFRTRHIKQYIFVATTGRSGSTSLTNLFNEIEGCASYHEPYPVMHRDPDSEASGNPTLLGLRKIVNIKRSSIGYDYYVETNHQFIKGFYADVFHKLPHDKISVICLKRAAIRSALSFYSIGSIPGVTENGKTWLLDPENPDNVINIYTEDDTPPFLQSDFIKCLWYVYETYARTHKIRALNPDIRWVDMQTDELNSLDGVTRLLEQLGIPCDSKNIGRLIGIKANLKLDKKNGTIDLTEATAMKSQFDKYLIDCGLGDYVAD